MLRIFFYLCFITCIFGQKSIFVVFFYYGTYLHIRICYHFTLLFDLHKVLTKKKKSERKDKKTKETKGRHGSRSASDSCLVSAPPPRAGKVGFWSTAVLTGPSPDSDLPSMSLLGDLQKELSYTITDILTYVNYIKICI